MTNSDLKQFIEKYKKLIDNREYEEVFAQALLKFGTSTGKLTELFYKCGIDPLEYMSKVPDFYASKSRVQSINIPNNITSIGKGAFFTCLFLTGATIGNGVTDIGTSAFCNCAALTSINISNSVSIIGSGAFINCTNLKAINYAGSKEQWNSINKGVGWNAGSGIKTIRCKDGIINI